jgi:hypothetical protein
MRDITGASFTTISIHVWDPSFVASLLLLLFFVHPAHPNIANKTV